MKLHLHSSPISLFHLSVLLSCPPTHTAPELLILVKEHKVFIIKNIFVHYLENNIVHSIHSLGDKYIYICRSAANRCSFPGQYIALNYSVFFWIYNGTEQFCLEMVIFHVENAHEHMVPGVPLNRSRYDSLLCPSLAVPSLSSLCKQREVRELQFACCKDTELFCPKPRWGGKQHSQALRQQSGRPQEILSNDTVPFLSLLRYKSSNCTAASAVRERYCMRSTEERSDFIQHGEF